MVLNFLSKDKIYKKNQIIKDYTICKLVGEGRFGHCYLVTKDNKQYILKQLKKETLKETKDKLIYEEKILSNLDVPYIPKFIEKFEMSNTIIYILEYIDGKTFEDIIFQDNYIFSKEEINKIFIKLINIIKILHSKNIVHKDIRVPNVILKDNEIYLIDFGLSRFIDNEKYFSHMDFYYLGDFLIHLYYTSYECTNKKSKPWYEELNLNNNEQLFLKKLMGLEEKYEDIYKLENDFIQLSKKG